MKLLLESFEYDKDATISHLFVDSRFSCLILEDAVRPVKIAGETAIPEGIYQIIITWSPRFKRRLPLLVGVPGFDAIRVHPGNDANDTEGCLLPGDRLTTIEGKPFLLDSRVAFERLYADLLDAENRGESISIEVIRGRDQRVPEGSSPEAEG